MTEATNLSIRRPLSLRGVGAAPGATFAAACLAGVTASDRVEAQDSALPALTVDAPTQRHRAAPPKPTPAQQRARASLRQMARARAAQPAARQPSEPARAPTAAAANVPADADPYAEPGAPYKVNRVSSSFKFPETIANTARTITVLSKEVLDDKGTTSLRDVARTTAGVTLGTGEGGNAFGDRFFVRGFDVRNDIFIDGVRDPGVSIRENFFTEQVEIMRGPGSAYAGRGTAGGAINIVPKQATDRDFQTIEGMAGTDRTRRVTFDVNQTITPTLSVRAGGLLQGASVAGRDVTTDYREGAFLAVKWTPLDSFTLRANYIYTNLHGIPDFGVPYYRVSNAVWGSPVTEIGVNRDTFYGFANRDFQQAQQNIGTLNGEYRVNDIVTLSNKLRVQESLLAYVGTLAQRVTANGPLANWTVSTNPQSRHQITDVIADQAEARLTFATGAVNHIAVAGAEFSHESVKVQNYTNLVSEAFGGGSTSSSITQNLADPQYTYLSFPTPALNPASTGINVATQSAYLLDTANYNDVLFVNGGVRMDNYAISSANAQGRNEVDALMFNSNAGVLVKPLPTLSLYGAYATSSNPYGAELDSTSYAYGGLSPTTNQVFGPERNLGYEIGAKWELFDRKLLATAALFRTEKTNARDVGATTTAGAAYEIEGIDLGAGGNITEDWSVFSGLVLMRSKVTESHTAPANTTMYKTNVGLPLANIAHQSFNILTKYKIDPTWEVGGQATYMSQIFGGTLAANAGTVLPAHWRFDAFVEANLTKQLTLKASVNNIFNQLYYDAFYRSLSPFTMVAPGRAAYLTVTAKF
ncbi:catecholate siderophore receptor [Rhodoblastus acidophilus]|uniref:TonB-dependent receptor n=1 Tax=Rhodoblastus acidophilus TaxID=1074 RepID=UPI002224736B|nr:TonB-dependent receptor [Rhodoblastus acidophilus]MCW2283781.1 catecholate siderophore receptor [Rhodoblastus acidophilus]MCW2332870.1 catecholate siderophore receptor [Rhodoblastus acidophilus]